LLGQKETPTEGYGYYWSKPTHNMKNLWLCGKILNYAHPHKMIFKYTYFLSINQLYNIHTMKPRILILGGGVWGLVSVNKLAKIFKDQAEITLIIYAQLPLGGNGL
jgi:hypothetical protein